MAPLALRDFVDLIGRNEQELRLRIDKVLDQPRACNAIHVNMGTSNPLHIRSP